MLPDNFENKLFTPLKLKHTPKTKLNKNIGVDTETNKNGNLILIATSDGDYLLDRNGITTSEALTFLTKKENCNLWFFNIHFDYDSITKDAIVKTTIEKNKEIFRKGNYTVHIPIYGSIIPTTTKYNYYRKKAITVTLPKMFNIKYKKGMYLQISKRKNDNDEFGKSSGTRIVKAYDVSNFFNEAGLDETAKKILGEGKGNLANEEILKKGYNINDADTIPDGLLIQRCLKDAELTAELAKVAIKTIENIAKGLNYPENEGIKYTSPASVTKQIITKTLPQTELQPFLNCEKNKVIKLQEYAQNAYHGGLNLLFEKGYHKDLDSIDIASAYPNILRTLPSLEGAYIVETTTLNPKANFGFYHVKAQYNGYMPLTIKGVNIYPITEKAYDNWLTKEEVLYLQHNNYKCQVLKGMEVYLPKNPMLIFKPFIDTIYKQKSTSKEKKDADPKENALYHLTKGLMNRLYGLTAEKRYGTGTLTNFVYATTITARVRIRIQNSAKRYFKSVVEISTDSITGYLKPEYKNYFPEHSNALGQFEYDTKIPKEIIVLANGLSIVVNEETKQPEFYKRRGFGATASKGLKKQKGTVTIKKDRLEVTINRPLHSNEAILQKKSKLINVFSNHTKQYKFNDNNHLTMNKINWKTLLTTSIPIIPFDDFYLDNLQGLPEIKELKD